MKYKLLFALIAVGVLAGCSHLNQSTRVPASVKDIGVIGDNGEVLLYYKDGDYIIVKACEPNSVLGIRPEEARSNCQGKSNKVPVEVFRDYLKRVVSPRIANVLKPLTSEEVNAYIKGGPNSDKVEAMVKELERINNFIAAYGEDNANLVQKESLVKALRSHETRVRATNKINAEVDKAVSLIINQTKLTLTKFNSDKDQFLYTVLKQFNPYQNFPCGLEGSVEERIKDCSYKQSSVKKGFVLVTRSKKFKEVYKELDSGLLWGDRLSSKMDHYEAQKACKSGLDEVAGITGVNWRLPSISEYQEAEKNGIRKALPNMSYSFWSSSVHRKYSYGAWVFNDSNGNVNHYSRDKYDGSVRCIAR